MRHPQANPKSALIASFFQRLGGIERVARAIVKDSRTAVLITLRGEPERRVLLDFSRVPMRVVVDGEAHEGRGARLGVTVDADVLHRILLGRMTAGQAFGRRQLLVRGSAALLARFSGLFGFAPVLYKEFAMKAADLQGAPIPLQTLNPVEKALARSLDVAAWSLGYGLGLLRYRLFPKMSLFDVLEAMSRGLAAATPPDRDEAST
jgi:hypothetical protein